MRKSFHVLSGLVRNELNRESTNGDVFVFLNRNRSHFKLLHWERSGFVLYYKRLERERFTSLAFKEDQISFTWPQLVLIEGITVEKSVQELRYSR